MKISEVIDDCKRLSMDLDKKSSGKPKVSHYYSGYDISTYLKQQLPFKQVEFYAEDGFALALSASEACENLLLVDCIDGKPLLIEEGLTLVITNDTTSRRWCKYITEMQVKR